MGDDEDQSLLRHVCRGEVSGKHAASIFSVERSKKCSYSFWALLRNGGAYLPIYSYTYSHSPAELLL